MELIKFKLGEKYNLGKLAVALGEFDGLHIAHQELIKKAINYAKANNIKSAVVSFDPHPDYVLKKRFDQGYITPMKAKAEKLEELGVDYFIVIPFTIELAKLSPNDFINNYLKAFEIEKVVVGFDFRFGHRGSGNSDTLREHFKVEVVERITLHDEKIGSNEIRDYLIQGEMEKVKNMLGRYYNITGKVVSGNQVGRTLGIRTANIQIEERYQVLRKGVYAVYVSFNNKRYFGVCNIGNNPTINYVSIPRLEVHILDFNQEIYDEVISVDFVKFLRDEEKFASVEAMIAQINQDIINTKAILEKNICE
jgi:riboflavin kinase/FMN adenylyltransferase